jgi:hypothetical protein
VEHELDFKQYELTKNRASSMNKLYKAKKILSKLWEKKELDTFLGCELLNTPINNCVFRKNNL